MTESNGFRTMYVAAGLIALAGLAVLLAGTARERNRIPADELEAKSAG